MNASSWRTPSVTRLLVIAGSLLVVLVVLALWRWSDSPITDADFASRVEPSYPQVAFRAGIHGQVVVSITVGSDGRLLASSIQSSSGSTLLDDAALEAVRESMYRPPVLLGIPMERSYTVTFTFADFNASSP